MGGAGPSVAPMAVGSFSQAQGIYGIKPLAGPDGRVVGMRVRGCDYVGNLDVDGEPAGTTLFNISLNPMDEAWSGTQLQQQARLFERYRPLKVCAMVEPVCPATTAGQTLAYIDPDPDDPIIPVNTQGIQMAASHQGAGVAQVWQLNACSLVFDRNTADYFADADGSDERLISPGSLRVIANSAMPAATPIATIFVIWEYEFRVPQLDDSVDGPALAVGSGHTAITRALILGTGTWASMAAGGPGFNTFSLNYTTSGGGVSGSTLYNIPEGNYLILATVIGTNSPTLTCTVDGVGVINPENPTDTTPAAVGGAASTTACCQFYVVRVVYYQANASVGAAYVQLTEATGAPATVTGCSVWIVKIPDVYNGPMLAKHMTLQMFQRDVLSRLAAIEGGPRLPHPLICAPEQRVDLSVNASLDRARQLASVGSWMMPLQQPIGSRRPGPVVAPQSTFTHGDA